MPTGPVNQIAIGFILLVISYLIALTVLPLLADQVAVAQANSNITGSNDTLLSLVTTVVIAGLVLGALGFITVGTVGAVRSTRGGRRRR